MTFGAREGAILRLLIDACLSPAVVSHLTKIVEDRVDAVHIDRVAPPGMSDDAILDLALRDRRAVVTANSRDFLALARRRPDHPGLILVDDQNTRDRQVAAIARIVTAMLARTDGSIAGRVFTLARRERPPGRAGVALTHRQFDI